VLKRVLRVTNLEFLHRSAVILSDLSLVEFVNLLKVELALFFLRLSSVSSTFLLRVFAGYSILNNGVNVLFNVLFFVIEETVDRNRCSQKFILHSKGFSS
jgi:hypothetical protein